MGNLNFSDVNKIISPVLGGLTQYFNFLASDEMCVVGPVQAKPGKAVTTYN